MSRTYKDAPYWVKSRREVGKFDKSLSKLINRDFYSPIEVSMSLSKTSTRVELVTQVDSHFLPEGNSTEENVSFSSPRWLKALKTPRASMFARKFHEEATESRLRALASRKSRALFAEDDFRMVVDSHDLSDYIVEAFNLYVANSSSAPARVSQEPLFEYSAVVHPRQREGDSCQFEWRCVNRQAEVVKISSLETGEKEVEPLEGNEILSACGDLAEGCDRAFLIDGRFFIYVSHRRLFGCRTFDSAEGNADVIQAVTVHVADVKFAEFEEQGKDKRRAQVESEDMKLWNGNVHRRVNRIVTVTAPEANACGCYLCTGYDKKREPVALRRNERIRLHLERDRYNSFGEIADYGPVHTVHSAHKGDSENSVDSENNADNESSVDSENNANIVERVGEFDSSIAAKIGKDE